MNNIYKFYRICAVLILMPALLLAQPTLTSPANGDTGVSIQPTFQWSQGSNNEKFQVSTSSTFGTTVIDKAFTGNETSYTLTEAEKLDNNTTYYWRVSTNGGNPGSWSSTFSFTTIPSVTLTLGTPANNSTVYVTGTYFSWYSSSYGSIQFKVQVTSKSSGSNPDWTQTPDFEATTSQIYYTFNLLQGKTYWWRVIALTSGGDIISYSSANKFTTAGGAETPTLSYPTGGTTVYYNKPTFSWYINGIGTDVTFDIQVDDDNAFGSPAIDVTNISNYFYTATTALAGGTTFYWRVRAVYKRGTSDEVTGSWTSNESFVTQSTSNLAQPKLSYPTDGVTVYTTSPYMYWYTGKSTTGVTFDLYYKESTAGSFTKANSSDITSLYYQLTGLTAGKTYNWYVVAKEGSSTMTSATESFVVYQASSGSAVAFYPTNGETVYSLKPTVYWYLNGSSTGLTKYTVRWKADNNSSDWGTDYKGTADITSLTQTYYTFTSNLTYGKTYYWAVAAYGTSYGTWSSGSFVVYGSSTVTPTLSYPVGGVTVYTKSPTLYWYLNGSTAGVVGYEVHYSKDGFVSTDNTVSPNPTTNSVQLSNLTPGATYSWKVKTLYSSTSSGFSTTETFVVDPGASPVQPLIGGPNNVVINNDSPTLSWVLPVQSESQLTYEVEYSTNSDMSNSTVVSGLANPYDQLSGLSAGETYYWRARSKTSNGDYSDYSPIAHFTLDQTTGVEEETIPEKFTVWQNYPNPFNPSTIIKFALPSKMNVKLSVYDILGREVAELFNGELEAGNHDVEFNADAFGLTSGIYFYRVQAGNNISVRKMMLIK